MHVMSLCKQLSKQGCGLIDERKEAVGWVGWKWEVVGWVGWSRLCWFEEGGVDPSWTFLFWGTPDMVMSSFDHRMAPL